MKTVSKTSGKPGRGPGTQNPGIGGTSNAAANPNQPQTGNGPNWQGSGIAPLLPTRPARPVTDNVGVSNPNPGGGGSGPGPDPYLDQPVYQP